MMLECNLSLNGVPFKSLSSLSVSLEIPFTKDEIKAGLFYF